MEGLDSTILTKLSSTVMLGFENVEFNHSNYLPDQDLLKVLGKFVVLYSGTTTCRVYRSVTIIHLLYTLRAEASNLREILQLVLRNNYDLT
jgi:hypothetical protein